MRTSPPLTWYIGSKVASAGFCRFPDDPRGCTVIAGRYDCDVDGKVSLWSVPSGDVADRNATEVATVNTPGQVTAMKVVNSTQSNPYAVVADDAGSVQVFSVQRDGLASGASWKQHTVDMTCVDARLRGSSLECVSAGADGRIVLYDANHSNPAKVIDHADSGSIAAIRFLAQSTDDFVSVSSSAHLSQWDARSPSARPVKIVKGLAGSSDVAIHCLDVHPAQPHYLVVGSSDGVLTVWDTRNTPTPVSKTHAHTSNIWQVRFHEHLTDNLLTCGNDGTALWWNFNAVQTSMRVNFATSAFDDSTIAIQTIHDTDLPINTVDIDPYNNRVICGTDSEALILKDVYL